MYVLNSKINIGNVTFTGVNELEISESIHEYKNTCVIKLPASAVIKQAGKVLTGRANTAHQFKRGQKVTVELGYNGKLMPEFKGFVERVNLTSPVEIECEGYSYLLRNKKNIVKSWKTTTLLEVLKFMVADTGIKLHPKIPDMPLVNLVVNNASGTELLDYLIDLSKDTLTACFFDDVLYVGLRYADVTEKTVKYRFGFNTISVDGLKYHKSEDVQINVQFKLSNPDGTKSPSNQGKKGGIVLREEISLVKDQTWLEEIAKTKLQQETFDGYEGDLETFLEPYCRIGYRAETTDPRYPERGGNYFVESVKVTYGMGGGRRNPEIGIKLS